MPRVQRKTKGEDLARVRRNQQACRQRRRDYVADLESRIAYYEAATQADQTLQATEALRRENQALRDLLDLRGISPNLLEHGPAEYQGATLNETQSSIDLVGNTWSSTVEPPPSTPQPLNGISNPVEPPTTAEVTGLADSNTFSLEFPPSSWTDFTGFINHLPEPESEHRSMDFPSLINQNISSAINIGMADAVLGETTLCAVAIQIACLCNKKDVNILELDTMLRQGYRSGSPMEGCRVDNAVLLSVLAEII